MTEIELTEALQKAQSSIEDALIRLSCITDKDGFVIAPPDPRKAVTWFELEADRIRLAYQYGSPRMGLKTS